MKSLFRRRTSARQAVSDIGMLDHDDRYKITPFILPQQRGSHSAASGKEEICISNESDFRISRVLDGLEISEASTASLSGTIQINPKYDTDDQIENLRDISSSARAYLPASLSLLTHTTSHERLLRAACFERLTNDNAEAEQVRTWPSSVMLQAVSSPIKLPADWSDGIEAHIDDTIEMIDESISHKISVHSSPQGPQVRLSRIRTCPALRGFAHAHRQRESIMSSPRQQEKVDEFGKWREIVDSIEKSTEDDPIEMPFKSCRDTFGPMVLPHSFRTRTKGRMMKTEASRAALSSLNSNQSTNRAFTSPSTRTSSIRSRRCWQLDEILPSPCETMFRFPTLCVAAVEQSNGVVASPSLSSARFQIFGLGREEEDDDRASLALSGISALTRSSTQVKEVKSDLLGSPILLASEVAMDTSRSLSSSYDSNCSTPSMDCDVAFLQYPSLLARPKSDCRLSDQQSNPKPQPLLQSQSLPLMIVGSTDNGSNVSHQRTPSANSVQQIIFAQQCHMNEVRAKFIKTSCAPVPVHEDPETEDEKLMTDLSILCSDEVEPKVEQEKRIVLEKGVQTDPLSSPTISKSGRRKGNRKKRVPRHSSPTKKTPGICISLPSPRIDEEYGQEGWTLAPSLGTARYLSVPTSEELDKVDEQPCTSSLDLLVPTLTCHAEVDDPLVITTPSTPVLQLTFEDRITDALDCQAKAKNVLRESTTTAAIEAMLDHLYRARDSKPSLSSGGRRHAKAT